MQETPTPVIPASQKLPEITVKAFVLGAVLAAVLAGANAYLGLKVGMTVSASIPAAVISMAVLRLFRKSNILENNLVQTSASAGESLAAGVIFTLPALVLLGYWKQFEYLPTMAIALIGGVLGVMFTIPLRRALIIESRLRFPEGVATGEVLKAGAAGGQGARYIAIAGIAGALLKLGQSGLQVIAGRVSTSVSAGRATFGFGSELGVALLAVGYIVGLDIAILVLAGGLISWLFGIPIYMLVTDPATLAQVTGGTTGYAAAEAVWAEKIRYLGVGAMATGGLWALISLIQPIRDGIRSSLQAVRKADGTGPEIPRTERDIPITVVLISTLVLAVPLFVTFWYVVDRDSLGVSAGMHLAVVCVGLLFALLTGFVFSSVAGYMAGLVGSSNNPISGVTIATILAISVVLLMLLGSNIDFAIDKEKALTAAAVAIMVGGAVCCAAAIAGDNMQDLKAGQLVGATPYKQQLAQILGVVAGAVTIAPVLQLLFSAYGLGDVFPREGMDPNQALRAPQSVLMAAVALGVFLRNLPWGIIGLGAALAVALISADWVLARYGSRFRIPVLAVAVGIYLPVELSVPIFVGGLVAHLAGKALRNAAGPGVDMEQASRGGLLFASGLITGEALVGILLAIPFAAAQRTDVLALPVGEGFAPIAEILGLIGFAGFTVWLYRVARRPG